MTIASRAVLIVEDDAQIRRVLRTLLELEQFRIIEAETAELGLSAARTYKPDLIIVDLGLPDTDGVDVIRELRTWTEQPVIVLSARSHEDAKVGALDAGADDYLTKPFSVSELLARIRAQLRRRNRGGQQETPQVRFGAVSVDLSERRVTREGVLIHLTPIEYRLLTALVRHAGRVITHQQLLREVWGPTRLESQHYLRVYMGHLRHKLELDPTQPVHILTETGVGYRLVGAQ
jgi:two-component system, OmpR family, KDP operon response regulator KdpE